eukprot:9491271-Pyramimonas_sp.AAC.1
MYVGGKSVAQGWFTKYVSQANVSSVKEGEPTSKTMAADVVSNGNGYYVGDPLQEAKPIRPPVFAKMDLIGQGVWVTVAPGADIGMVALLNLYSFSYQHSLERSGSS